LDDAYPLVVELPCHKTHRFDLDCVGPWLRLNGTCPLDRKDLMKKREVPMKSKEISTKREDFPAKKRWPKTGIWRGEVKM